ncbi:MAG TPA: Coq4 family protein [Pyrinomonadaceae bacterium]|jgi:hypothetical protein|nr:Coq4 family protein [Pyrinomonadaceae bacterium]
MTIYQPEMTLREARVQYFAENDFGADGGYGDRWVKIKFGPVPIFFPNIPSRASAVRYHDLHHILTEYPTTLEGEAEIAAWEVATGDLPNFVGWFLDLGGLSYGLLLYPRSMWRAFLRGRRSRSLYPVAFTEELLSRKVGEVREALKLDQDSSPARMSERLAFLKWSLLSGAVSLSVGALFWTPMTLLGLFSLVAGERWAVGHEEGRK